MATAFILLVLNAVSFAAYGADKRFAKLGTRRIPEKTLLALAVLGAAGAYLGMQVFRHKTRKPLFKYGVPAILVLEVLAAAFLMS